MLQRAVPVTVPRCTPEAGPDTVGAGSALLVTLIAAIGRAKPSDAVRRYNWVIAPGQDPFLRHYFPVVAAFRRGAALARRPMTSDGDQRDPQKAVAGNRLLAEIGRRVKAAREKAHLTQSTVERNARVTPCTVAAIERGEIHADDFSVVDLVRIAEALSVDPRDLLPGEPPG